MLKKILLAFLITSNAYAKPNALETYKNYWSSFDSYEEISLQNSKNKLIESWDKIRQEYRSEIKLFDDQQLEKIRELEKNKVQVSAMYILGFPTDTDETINKTINYSKKLNTTYAQFSVWTPYPGTPVFNEYKDKITAKNYDEFDQYHLVYDHNLFDKKNIRKYLSKAYSSYYLRINWLFKYFRSFITS